MELESLVIDSLHRYALKANSEKVSPTHTLIVALSGGLDSTVLLHLFSKTLSSKLPQQRPLTVLAAHVNHGLRDTSARDEEFVVNLCKEWQVPLHVHRLSSVPTGENVEAWTRMERYKFFESVRSGSKADLILTAHHADDFLETYLMRLLANKEPRPIGECDLKRCVLRPLLAARRGDLMQYARMHHLNYVEDETNQDIRFTRNRIRHELIPYLTQNFGDSAWASLYERAQCSAADDALLSNWASGFLSPIRELSFGSVAWLRGVRGALEAAPEPLRWRITEQALLELVKYRLGRTKATEASLVLLGERVAVQIPGGMELRRSKGEILVRKAHDG